MLNKTVSMFRILIATKNTNRFHVHRWFFIRQKERKTPPTKMIINDMTHKRNKRFSKEEKIASNEWKLKRRKNRKTLSFLPMKRIAGGWKKWQRPTEMRWRKMTMRWRICNALFFLSESVRTRFDFQHNKAHGIRSVLRELERMKKCN